MIAANATGQLATFQLEDLWLGIDIGCIREINRVGEITPVPDAPACVRGVINLRGDVVTVMDLRTILQRTPGETTPRTRLIIVESGDEKIGLLVDRVADIVPMEDTDMESLPANLAGANSRYFNGMCRIGTDLLVVLDVAAALALTENEPNAVRIPLLLSGVTGVVR